MTVSRAQVAERYARATQSSDLSVRPNERCDADVLLAAGYAASNDRRRSIALDLYRMGVRNDLSGISSVAAEMSGWLTHRLARKGGRPMPKVAREALVMSVLRWWIKPACPFCNGTGYDVIEESNRLSDNACSNCHGSGKTPVGREVPGPLRKHAEWLGQQLDELIMVVHGDMAKLLAERMEL